MASKQMIPAVLLLLLSGLCCQPVASNQGEGQPPTPAEPLPTTMMGAHEPEMLIFPPPRTARADRGPLPQRYVAAVEREPEAPRIYSPYFYGDDRSFSFSGRSFRLRFDRPIERPTPPDGETHSAAKAGTLTIEPAVSGKATWFDDRTLVFEADEHFDPEQTYTLTLGRLESKSGGVLEEGWTAKFDAEIAIGIAGKVINYVPEPGKPRVVAIHPADGRTVRGNTRLSVLFDQPVDAKFARESVALRTAPTGGEGKKVPVKVRMSKRDRWGSHEIDRKQVVVLEPKRKLQRGDSYLISAANHPDADSGEPTPSEFTIANRLALETVDCGWGYDPGDCEYKGGVLTTDGREFSMVFNNQVPGSREKLLEQIKITPKVKNLGTYGGWDDGRVYIYGDFEPSTVYRVKASKLIDVHGSKLADPVDFRVVTRARPASASIPEGRLLLDAATSRGFPISTRNVDTLRLEMWPVGDGGISWADARRLVSDGKVPESRAPLRIPVRPKKDRDRIVNTQFNLTKHLEVGRSYLTSVSIESTRHGAEPLEYPEWSHAGRPAVALITPGNKKTLAVHARKLPDSTLVHVARLESGKPVSGAELTLAGRKLAVRTDAQGFAEIDGNVGAGGGLLEVSHGGQHVELDVGTHGHSVASLTPGMQASSDAPSGNLRGMVITDRGIYRPGSRIEMRGTVRLAKGEKLVPAPATTVALRVLGPTGEELSEQILITDDMGSVTASFDTLAGGSVGRHRLVLVAHGTEDQLAEEVVQVAAFERPRFTVDVDAERGGSTKKPAIKATVLGRYLFGAGMDGAEVGWTLRRSEAALPRNDLSAAGFAFREQKSWWEEEHETPWMRSGMGNLDAKGMLELSQFLDMSGTTGPQRFHLEAEVTDSSYRAITGKGAVVIHPAKRYAGLKLKRPWADVGKPLAFEMGVVDRDGKVVEGAKVTAKLERVRWRSTKKRGPGGSTRWEWHETYTTVGKCTVKSAHEGVSCPLKVSHGGEYRLSTSVDGRLGGRRTLYAWWDDEDEGSAQNGPSRGHRLHLITDKGSYSAGDTAKVLVRSPFDEATAIFTVEQGGVLRREMRVIKGTSMFSVPVTLEHAPNVNVTVTLLPRGAKGDARADWKFGAARIPVDLDGARLNVEVDSDAADYRPGGKAKVTVKVRDGGRPVEGAEVALAVVDEGVLRLTNFHAADPVSALRPAHGLRYWIRDTRDELAAALALSHVAGDGLGSGSQTMTDTRRDFVETLAWKPGLRTGTDGTVEVDIPLSDDLTRFRMMAVVLDRNGKGGNAEHDFAVSKPVMLIPAVPRFAVVGDQFEMAAMLHNNRDEPLDATVTLSGQRKPVHVPARASKRIGFAHTVESAKPIVLDFAVEDGGGEVLDRVESKVEVQIPGIDERPYLAGSFTGEREVVLRVPGNVSAPPLGADEVELQVGQHLSPNFVARMRYLLDYPHGCVEQTTSSTLPLIAARDILPRLGEEGLSRQELDERITVGLERLDRMRTDSGGLAYWPGGSTPNVYGTAYAIRAVIRAKAVGVEPPVGLLEGMVSYLQDKLLAADTPAEVRAAIAQSLAELGSLPASAADPLWDGVDDMGVFGKASLAIALSKLDGQDERVSDLLDDVSGRFDRRGRPTYEFESAGFYYYGSLERDRAQAAIAMSRLRKTDPVLAAMRHDLGNGLPRYTTQAAAFELLAVAESLGASGNADAEFQVLLDGKTIEPESRTEGGIARYTLPLSQIKGSEHRLRFVGPNDTPIQFALRSRWREHGSNGLVGTVGDQGPTVHRVYTDIDGKKIDLSKVAAGQVLRVAVYVRVPDDLDDQRMGYVALTDRLPAGFEPIQPDLATVSSAPDISNEHPFYALLNGNGVGASHVEMRDDRVDFYFDSFWRRDMAATYMVRATTPGTFLAPAPIGELMYEPDGTGYGMPKKVTVQ